MKSRDLMASVALLVILLVLILVPWSGWLADLVNTVRRPVVSTREADDITAGYYEDLLNAGAARGAAPIGLVRSTAAERSQAPADWPRLQETDGVIWDDESYLRFVLAPNSGLMLKGAPLDVNADGFRDRPYERVRNGEQRRIALVGSSITMGEGVPVDVTYENIVEDALAEQGHDVAILNLAVSGYRGTQLLDVVQESVSQVDPDGLLLILNDLTVNPKWARHIIYLLIEGRDLKYPYLRQLKERAGIIDGMSYEEIQSRLEPFKTEVNEWWITEAVTAAKSQGIPVAILVVPQPATVHPLRKRVKALHSLLGALDVPIISLYHAYDSVRDQSTLWLEPWDRHPNAKGHALLADAVIQAAEQRADFRAVLLGEQK